MECCENNFPVHTGKAGISVLMLRRYLFLVAVPWFHMVVDWSTLHSLRDELICPCTALMRSFKKCFQLGEGICEGSAMSTAATTMSWRCCAVRLALYTGYLYLHVRSTVFYAICTSRLQSKLQDSPLSQSTLTSKCSSPAEVPKLFQRPCVLYEC